jgi:hypothetical protein
MGSSGNDVNKSMVTLSESTVGNLLYADITVVYMCTATTIDSPLFCLHMYCISIRKMILPPYDPYREVYYKTNGSDDCFVLLVLSYMRIINEAYSE